MKITLKLKVGSISVNSCYYSRNKRYTQKAREYRKEFLTYLSQDANKAALKEIRDFFNPKKHVLRITFNFYYPINILTRKEGGLSRRAKDLDNTLKPVIDFLCQDKYMTDPKYAKEIGLSSISNLAQDDQFIGEVCASKRKSIDDTNYLIIGIETLDLDTFINTQIDF